MFVLWIEKAASTVYAYTGVVVFQLVQDPPLDGSSAQSVASCAISGVCWVTAFSHLPWAARFNWVIQIGLDSTDWRNILIENSEEKKYLFIPCVWSSTCKPFVRCAFKEMPIWFITKPRITWTSFSWPTQSFQVSNNETYQVVGIEDVHDWKYWSGPRS